MGWLAGWNYRKSHIITGSVDGVQTNYQVGIKAYYGNGTDGTEVINGITHGKIYCSSKCKTDFGDLRFTDSSGNLCDYFIINKIDSNYALIWVEIPTIPSSPNTTTIYVYYGNTSATIISNLDNTFIFGQDFRNSTNFDTNKWDSIGSPTITATSDGIAVNKTGGFGYLVTDNTIDFSNFKRILTRRKVSSTTTSYMEAFYVATSKETSDPYETADSHILFGHGRNASAIYKFDVQVWISSTWTRTALSTSPETTDFCDCDMRVSFGAPKANYLINGTEHYSSTIVPSGSNGYIYIGVSSQTYSLTGTFAYVLVGNFTENEPTHTSFGNEETPFTSGSISILMSSLGLI